MTKIEKFSHKVLTEYSKSSMFLVLYVIITLILMLIFSIVENSTFLRVLFASSFLSLLISGVMVSMIGLGRAGLQFYDEASEIEQMIRNGEDKENTINRLFLLKKKSFHRTTGERVIELAKMAEIKYDIQLLKR